VDFGAGSDETVAKLRHCKDKIPQAEAYATYRAAEFSSCPKFL
jgi:hypothetical protein